MRRSTRTSAAARGRAREAAERTEGGVAVEAVEDRGDEGAADEDRDAGVVEEEEQVVERQRVAVEEVVARRRQQAHARAHQEHHDRPPLHRLLLLPCPVVVEPAARANPSVHHPP
eukprot:3383477-Rhodomonas_salina.2